MQRLSTEDRILQEKVIAYSNKIFKKDFTFERRIVNVEINIEINGIEYAKSIADYILDNAVRQQDKIYWLGMEEDDGTVKIRPIDIYFYNGIAGIAVFFRTINQVCGLYENVCEKLEKMLFVYTDQIYYKGRASVTEYPGMYCGEASIGYAYQLLYKITKERRYCEYADKHSQIIIRCSKKEAPFDLLYGNAGAVLVLCQQYIDTNDLKYLFEAQKVLEYLDNRKIESERGITWFEKAEGNPVCSIAHGNSGVMLAYARMQSLEPNIDYLSRIIRIMEYEDQFYSHEFKNWADLRKKGKDRWQTYAWCNGGIGVIAARLQAAIWNYKNRELLCVKDMMMDLMVQDQMCLCHGNIGNLIIVNKFNYFFAKYGELDERCDTNKLFDDKGISIKESAIVGFMGGMAGVGMGIILLSKQ